MKIHIYTMVVMIFALAGCTYTQGSRTADNITASAISYDKNMQNVVDAFIDDYRTQAQGIADDLAAAAIRAEIGPDGKGNAINLQLIMNKKVEQYALIEERIIGMRKKIIAAHQDMEHLLAYSAALKDYFKQADDRSQILNQSSEQMIQMLDKFVKGKKAPATP